MIRIHRSMLQNTIPIVGEKYTDKYGNCWEATKVSEDHIWLYKLKQKPYQYQGFIDWSKSNYRRSA